MKRLIAFVLMLIYFTVTTGFTVSMHYCMDKLDSAKISFTSEDECSKCGMDISGSDGCCRNEFKVVKLQQDQTQAFFTLINFSFSPQLNNTSYYLFDELLQPQKESYFNHAHAPPLISKLDTYLVNCVFRI